MKTPKVIAAQSAALLGLVLTLGACGATATVPQDSKAAEAQPAKATLAAQNVTNYRVRVVVDRVYCKDTEDITGADEFYAGGDLVVSKPDGTKKSVPFLMSPPVDLNNKMTWTASYTVLDEVVPADSDVVGKLVAYDEDAGKDWSNVGPKFMEAARVTGEELIKTGNSKAAIAAGALNAGMSILDAAMSADKDDVLGLFGFQGTTINSSTPTYISRSQRMYKTSTWGWSTWDYTMYYHLEIEPTTAAPTL
ncbi:hypothetical protein [Deinococcus maricopensis]|uniref:Lipoprotein n=1 Tax=Deinococcus maricopensis (strain DSM 21211 / LMG 22137 / NRRL B-23946 / LB-34) TaxID=709986 RepID=E8U780_DEIML|nr:hypothetical protein [Deinococcus maricopensis]ADV66919.1 hypothetical protein Deima_1268 [Deinococcus maricopensis DSM 21211]